MISTGGRPRHQEFGPPSPVASPTSSASSPCFGRSCCTEPKQPPPKKIWLCCCCYCPPSSTTLLTSFGVLFLVLVYTIVGALIFMALEGESKDSKSAQPEKSTNEIRSETVEKLWSITEDLNILYKENWTRLAAEEVQKFQDKLSEKLQNQNGVLVKDGGDGAAYYTNHQHRWSFASSYLYSLTLITTIGYGSITPKTAWGKFATAIYAIFGIPLMLIYLSTTGEILSRNFRTLTSRLFCNAKKKENAEADELSNKRIRNEATYMNTHQFHKGHNNIGECKINLSGSNDDEEQRLCKHNSSCKKNNKHGHDCHHDPPGKLPIFLSFLVVLCYVSFGAYVFHAVENWSYLEGALFCFTSLSTIGFGDMVPGLKQNVNGAKKEGHSELLSVLTASCFILMGMSLIAMSFNLVQNQVISVIKRLTKAFKVENEKEMSKDNSNGISMSIVSSNTS